MGIAEDEREAYVAKATAELGSLAGRGVRMAGNAFSHVAFAKGQLTEKDLGSLLSGNDGQALRKSLQALGYAPEDWVAFAAVASDGSALDAATLRETVCALDPDTLVACDEAAADALREAYAEELAARPEFEDAMLTAGRVVQVLGMRVLNLGGFEEALSSPERKQLMWARLKQIAPLGEPE